MASVLTEIRSEKFYFFNKCKQCMCTCFFYLRIYFYAKPNEDKLSIYRTVKQVLVLRYRTAYDS